MATRIERLIAAALAYQVANTNVKITGMGHDKRARDKARLALEVAALDLPKYLLNQRPAISRKLVTTGAAANAEAEPVTTGRTGKLH
jgi:hypothetical protein